MSSFHGLEMAKQALFAQQSALHTTSHNISNANTEGYTRQRVNFEEASAFPSASRNRPSISGQLGTGVKADSIERIRDQYIDKQFRGENSQASYWETQSDALERMENLMNETTDNGIAKSMDLFWNSLQDLATNPTNSGARSVVAQRAKGLEDSFNNLSSSLTSIRDDLKEEIEYSIESANALIKDIHKYNEQIKQLEATGYVANDLYDKRDRLIDELSGIVDIEVTYDKSKTAPEAAAGLVNIELVQGKNDSITLVKGESEGEGKLEYHELNVGYHEVDNLNLVQKITVGNGDSGQDISLDLNAGSLNALVHAYGYLDGNELATDPNQLSFPDMLYNLDDIVDQFVDDFNEVHNKGLDLNGDQPNEDFFTKVDGKLGQFVVNDEFVEDPDLIAASSNKIEDKDGKKASSDGMNALELAAVFDGKDSIKNEYESIIGELGVRTSEANRMADNTNILRSQVDNQRQSISSVSLDEEMSNMIKFQHAYNAAARSMTVTDEMLDKIINGMGIVGR